MDKGIVRVTFRLPYSLANLEHYNLPNSLTPEQYLVEMAKFDIENFPELLSEDMPASVEFDGWSE